MCRPKSPDCLECPINKNCQAFKNQNAESFPIKKTKPEKVELDLELIFLKFSNQIYRVKGLQHLLINEWMPLNCEKTALDDFKNKLKPFVKESWFSNDLKVSHSITHHKIRVGFSYFNLKKIPGFLKSLDSESWVLENEFKWTSSLVNKCLKKIQHL